MGRELLVVAPEILSLVESQQYENQLPAAIACGAIRYEVTAEPDCDVQLSLPRLPEDNRRSVHSCFLRPGERVQELPWARRNTSASTSEMMGDNVRGFCPECGSRLFGGKSDFDKASSRWGH